MKNESLDTDNGFDKTIEKGGERIPVPDLSIKGNIEIVFVFAENQIRK